ncbi:hypothetical protein RKD23_004330 [Streptomyces sp. SAI-170]|uniref:hypothetical protein n=1 Tax=Streptomyces sp. SAI-170 TaxID=3377729 RepID=UPI003C7DBC70
MTTTADVFVAEGTFGVLDAGDIPIETGDWSNGLAVPMSHGAVIVTGIHTGNVRVTAASQGTPMEAHDGTEWEEIVEISVYAPTGGLRIESLDLGPIDDLPMLSPAGSGWHRPRVHARGRETHYDGADMEPVEEYLLLAWPHHRADTRVIRSSLRIDDNLSKAAGQPIRETPPPPSASTPVQKPDA